VYLFFYPPKKDSRDSMDAAVRQAVSDGDFSHLSSLIATADAPTMDVMADEVVANRRIDLMQLLSRRQELIDRAYDKASSRGDSAIIKYIWDRFTITDITPGFVSYLSTDNIDIELVRLLIPAVTLKEEEWRRLAGQAVTLGRGALLALLLPKCALTGLVWVRR
jgi:hypothetical protein